MKTRIFFFVICLFLILFPCAVVDSFEFLPEFNFKSRGHGPPFIAASSDGQYFFKMVPAKWTQQENKNVITREAFGVAYYVDEDGNFRELWKTSGWYSSRVFLTDNGQYLVRVEFWGVGRIPTKNHLAIAFYEKGELLKQYSIIDLVEDKSKVMVASNGCFSWLALVETCDEQDDPENRLKLDYQDIFHLKTVDGIKYEFNVKSGNIISKKKH